MCESPIFQQSHQLLAPRYIILFSFWFGLYQFRLYGEGSVSANAWWRSYFNLGRTNFDLFILRCRGLCTTAVSPLFQINLGEPSHYLYIDRYTQTGDPSGIPLISEDNYPVRVRDVFLAQTLVLDSLVRSPPLAALYHQFKSFIYVLLRVLLVPGGNFLVHK